MKLDYVLGLRAEDFLERRFQAQTRQVYPSRPCSRLLEGHPCPSSFGGGRPGLVKRRNAKREGGDDAGSDADE
ncbi:hypothetical protein PRIPAC_77084 [Pristionchus pacificus]|uniref:Uncharacterized protein n=1 Tax=Pristionchus pacificus TaxID=54126 RepID=A0A2A6CJG3_PRIPA|nr:hypothetical protein PRIPAC_77084 [Pristionchus pacificus]|eukprot:PDM78217.1 hypothetical protein PRIPAC_30796 [Pristionchus pacificus]